MLLKLTGTVFIVMATTLMGIFRAEDIREQYRQMGQIQRFLSLLESEIRYGRTHLGEAFIHIAHQMQEPYRSWLLSMEKDMEKTDAGRFEEIWSRRVEEKLRKSGLSGQELERLTQLGGQFGAMDLELQLRVLDLYQEQLRLHMEEARENIRTRVRLCHCLGVMSGTLIAVLLV